MRFRDFVSHYQVDAGVTRPLFQHSGACTEVVNVAFEKAVGCEFKSHLEAVKEVDTVITVYDPDDPLCEREAAAGVVTRMLGKQLNILDPKVVRLS